MSAKKVVDDFLDSLKDQKPKEFEVICDSSNNTPESIARGELKVDMVFYGSLADYVRRKMEELSSEQQTQCNRS